MKTILVLLFAFVAINGQTASDLRRKYGDPLSQTFLVRPNITMTATFAKDGQPCEVVIEPQRPIAPAKSSSARLTLSVLDNIIDELVPVSQRGKGLFAGFVNAACLPDNDCAGTMSSYEKVFIYYNASGSDAYRYATVQWKNDACSH